MILCRSPRASSERRDGTERLTAPSGGRPLDLTERSGVWAKRIIEVPRSDLERQRRHDQSQGPPTGKGEGGAESQKAGSQRRPARPENPAGAVRSGTRFDKEPARECQHQELRRGETGRGTVEIGRAIERPPRNPCRVEPGQLCSAASSTRATWSASAGAVAKVTN